MNTGIEVEMDARAPQPFGDVLTRNQFLWTLQQEQQEVHRLTRQPDAVAAVSQFVSEDVDLEFAEAVLHGWHSKAIEENSRLFPDGVNGARRCPSTEWRPRI